MSRQKKLLITGGALLVILGATLVALPGRVTETPEDYFPVVTNLRDAPDDALTIAFLGDSYITGSGVRPGRLAPYFGFATRTAAALDLRPLYFGEGGTGYVADGHVNDPTFTPLPDRVSAVAAADPDIVVVAAGVNDATFSPAEVEDAATSTLCGLTRDLPDATVVAVGPWDVQIEGATHAALLAARDAVERAAGECRVQFLDPIADDWVPADSYGADGDHPNIHGHAEIADHLDDALRDLGL